MRELLLLSIGDARFGVWKDQVRSVADAHGLHSLPFSSSLLAGMAFVEGRPCVLADLNACLGYPPLGRAPLLPALLMPEAGGFSGFVTGRASSAGEVADSSVLPLPSCLATPLMDTCVLHGSAAIPLVNVALIMDRLARNVTEPPVPSMSGDRGSGGDWGSGAAEAVRLFIAAGEPFAVDGRSLAARASAPGPLSAIPGTPPFVRGIAAHEGAVIPVIDCALFLRGTPHAQSPLLMILETAGGRLGMLVDADQGDAPARDAGALMPLPPLLNAAWMGEALCREGRVIPVLRPALFLSAVPAADPGTGAPEGYGPANSLATLVEGDGMEVVELMRGGRRYALPRAEVEAVLPPLSVRGIPRTTELVRGAAVRDDECLPVLDLGARGSSGAPAGGTKPPAGMVLLRNGGFRALVLYEQLFESQRIHREGLRPVPVALPHDVIYCCYTDGEAVRLVVNLRSLALHYERGIAEGLLPALPVEREEPATGETAHAAPLPPAEEAPPALEARPAEEAPLPPPAEEPAPQPATDAADVTAATDTAAAETQEEPTAVVPPVMELEEVDLRPSLPGESEALAAAQEAPRTEEKKRTSRRRWLLAAALAAVVLAALYVAFRPAAPVTSTAATAPASSATSTAPAATTAPAAAPSTTEAPAPATAPAAAAPSTVGSPEPPASAPARAGTYTIVRGDTLWGISERFTGNPFNYRSLAEINAIPDPDLIHEGRSIRVK